MIITFAFRRANSVAAANPIPLVAPVIKNLLPERSGRLAALQRSGIVTVSTLHSPVFLNLFLRGAEGSRTPDPLHAMQVRYQLRYSPISKLMDCVEC